MREKFGVGFNSNLGFSSHPIPGIESHQEIVMRVKPFLKQIGDNYLGKNVLIVSHGSVLKRLVFHFGWQEIFDCYFDNLGFIKMEYDGKDFGFVEAQGIKKPRFLNL